MPNVEKLRQAMRYLAGVCDGAVSLDGHGFNARDTAFGRSLAEQEDWTENQAMAAIKVLRTYRNQLERAGFNTEEFFNGGSVTGPVRKPPKSKLVAVEGLYENGKLVGIVVVCPYEFNSKVKAIPSCRWYGKLKAWRLDLNLDIIGRIEQEFADVSLSEDVCQWRDRQAQLKKEILDLQQQEDTELQSELASRLYGFQRVGVKFLTKVRRAILGDDMGLGKTLQTIVVCEELHAQRVLVVCLNSLKGNWAEEIKKWAPHRPVTVLRGTQKQREKILQGFKEGYLIVNYEVVRWVYTEKRVSSTVKRVRSDKRCLIDDLLAMHWDVMLVDEAHNIKNRKSDQTEGIRELANKIDAVYLMTGTPIMNRVDELWSPLHVLYPKQYSSFWNFVRKHASAYPSRYGWVVDGKPTHPAELRREIAPVFLRREKEEVFPDMPRKVYQQVWLDLEGEQQRIYKEIEQNAMTQIDEDIAVLTPGILAQLTRCKQVAVSPGLLGGEPEGVKLDALMNVVRGTDQKILVFSQYAEAIKIVAKQMDADGVGHVIFIGDTPEAERSAVVQKFQTDPNVQLFLATMQAGGVGQTLTAASLVVFLDKHWTPAINEQAVDRTRPHMQTRPVQIIELLCRDTVDEMIEDVLAGKVSIIEAVIAKQKEVKKCLI